MPEDVNDKQINGGDDDKFSFIREEIKSRPLNKRKAAKNVAVASITAIAFGLVACLTFVILSPIVESMTERPRTNSVVSFNYPTETPEEEMSPADMLPEQEDSELDYASFPALTVDEINQIIASRKFTVNDYQGVYTALGQIVDRMEASLVKITATHEGTDWFNELYENSNSTSGLIIANNNVKYFILTYYDTIRSADSILVTFSNGAQVNGELVKADEESGLCVVSIDENSLNEVTKNVISVAVLGNSFSASLPGSLIISMGAPDGTYGSVTYGMVTSVTEKITVIDNFYRIVKTDIYGSKHANGFLVTLSGYVVGVIADGITDEDSDNMIAGYGITELRTLIESLSNNTEMKYFGVKCKDVPNEAYYQYDVPKGVYVESVELDSPAMLAGIQPGDIIASIGNSSVDTMQSFTSAMRNEPADKNIAVVVFRPVKDEYKELVLELTFGTR